MRSFPDGRGLRQVSNGGGFAPYWTKGGRELVYVVDTPAGATMMAVDVAVDGSRFAVLLTSTQQTAPKRTHVTLIFNFFDDIRRATSGAAK